MSRSKSILIVSNDLETAQLVTTVISRSFDFEVIIQNTRNYVSCLQDRDFMLVVLIVSSLGWVDFVQTIRNSNGIDDMPIIYLTPYHGQDEVEEAKQWNFLTRLEMPFLPNQLVEVVAHYC